MVRWEIKPHPCLTVQADLRPGPAKKPTGVRTRSKINCRISPNFLQFLQFFVMFSLSSLSLHKFEMESGISSGGASSPPDIRAEQESYNTGFFFRVSDWFLAQTGGIGKNHCESDLPPKAPNFFRIFVVNFPFGSRVADPPSPLGGGAGNFSGRNFQYFEAF